MARKLTYEELEQRVKALEREALDHKQVEKALRASEQRDRTVVQGAAEGILIADIERKNFLYGNPAICEMLGYTEQELVGMGVNDIHPKEDLEHVISEFEAQALGEKITAHEIPCLRKDGTTIYADVTTRPVVIDEKKCNVGFFTDITDRRLAEKALRESEDKFRRFFEDDLTGDFITTADSIILDCNPAFLRIFGYKSKAEAVGKSITELYPELSESRSIIDQLRVMGKLENYETTRKRKDDILITVNENIVATLDEECNIVEIKGYTYDITGRKRMEEALRESNNKFSSLFEFSPQAIALSAVESGKLLDVNKKFCELTKYSEEEIVGRTTTEVGFYSSADRDLFIKELRKSNEVDGLKMDFKTKDGSILKTLMFARVIKIEGKPLILTIFHDVTTQRLLEEQLRQAEKMEAIGTLAGGIAHDFNNILGIILGNTELALDDVPEWNPAQRNLREVQDACIRAKDTVRQILAFSRKTVQELKAVKIGPLVEESLRLLRASIPTTIEIRRNIAAESDTVMADPTQIHQVLMNLCTNAAQAMAETGGVLEITLVDEELSEDEVRKYEGLTPGSYVRLTVRDTGPGIDPSVLNRIFDPFFTTKGVGEGTGMGLSVVQGIVKSHHGSIHIETEVGKGSSFHILLAKTGEEEIVATESLEGFPTGHERILFVDDEAALARMGQLILERLGYQVESKTNPAEALAVFGENSDRFDLVITDMTMPQMTGESLARELLAIRPDIRIILCTGYSRIMDEDKARALGIQGFIMKPLSKSDMARTVRKVLDEQ